MIYLGGDCQENNYGSKSSNPAVDRGPSSKVKMIEDLRKFTSLPG